MSGLSLYSASIGASSPRAPWRLYGINAAFFAVGAALTPIYPFLMMQVGGSTTYFQVMSIACYAAQMAALFLSTRLLDKGYPVRTQMIVASGLFAVALVVGGLVRSAHTLLLVRIAEGFSAGLFAPAAALAVSARTHLGLGETFGQLSGVRNIARISALALGGALAAVSGKWAVLYVCAGILLLLPLGARSEDHDTVYRSSPVVPVAAPSAWRLSLVRGLTATAQGLLQPLFPFVAAAKLGFTPLAVGLVYALAGILSYLVPTYVGRVADAAGAGRPVVALSVLAVVSLLALGHSSSATVIVASFSVGFAVLVAATSLSQAAMVGQFPAERRGSGFARIEVSASVGRMVGPGLGALIYPLWGWSAACNVAAGIAVGTAAVMLVRVQKVTVTPHRECPR